MHERVNPLKRNGIRKYLTLKPSVELYAVFKGSI
jgi:hypothetical protein